MAVLAAKMKAHGRMAEKGPSNPATLDIQQRLEAAVQEHSAGNLAEAEGLYRRVLQFDPRQPVALNLLGVIAYQMTKYHIAVELLNTSISAKADYPEAHYNLGLALTALDQIDEALASFQKAVELNPDYADAHFHIANSLAHLGQGERAVGSYLRVLALNPGFAEAHCRLGNAYNDLQQLKDAAVCFEKAIALKPDYTEAHFNLGNCLKGLNKLDEAVVHFQKAIDLQPGYAKTHNNLGIVFKELKRYVAAVDSYRRAVDLDPNYADAHFNLGNVYQELKNPIQAEACYRDTLEINPNYADAHYNLGNILKANNRLVDAVVSYRAAISHKPDSADAHFNLANTLKELGQIDEASNSYRRALELEPKSLRYAVNAYTMQPIIMSSIEAIESWREAYRTGLDRLATSPEELRWNQEELNFDRFYLAYHNQNNIVLNASLSDVLRQHVTDLNWIAPQLTDWKPPRDGLRKLRIGFLSRYLRSQHTIGKLYQGLISQIDRKRFDLVLIHSPAAEGDTFQDVIFDGALTALNLAEAIEDQQAAVAAANLDVLFFPDIGMDPATYLLAHARMAPVQAVAWGHPDTTGIDTIDYFVSSRTIEPENANDHYREQLIQLGRLPCYYPSPEIPTRAYSLEDLGLPAEGTLYGCPQSLYKFHPDFDVILSEIAAGDPDGWIILIEGRTSTWADLLRQRWQMTAPALLDQVLFLPFLAHDRFIALQAEIDVLLDPVHFGAGNTMYEAMASGTPIVSWPGQFMRSRIVAAAYAQMGIADAPVVNQMEDYASTALALGRDPQRREQLAARTKQAAEQHLFSDHRVVVEFEQFFEAAVGAAGQGTALPVDWKPENS